MEMVGKFLLDTNIIIRLFGEDEVILDWLKKVSDIFVPCIVLGELLYGAQKSANVDANTVKIMEFSSQVKALPCDTETAQHYANIKNMLRKKGRPIPENDIWIGSIAKQYNLTLVTGDSHFKEIEGIKLTEI
jgi:tRNA(fMet)-specific endonuclease VapC